LVRRGHVVTVLAATPWKGGDAPYRTERYDHRGIPVVALSINPAAASQSVRS
jgi:hypothetical protein